MTTNLTCCTFKWLNIQRNLNIWMFFYLTVYGKKSYLNSNSDSHVEMNLWTYSSVCLSVYPFTQTRSCLRAEGVLMYRLFGESWSKKRAKCLCQNALLQVRCTGPSPAGTHSCKKKQVKEEGNGGGIWRGDNSRKSYFFPRNAQLSQLSQSNTPESIKVNTDTENPHVKIHNSCTFRCVYITYRDCSAWRLLRAALGTVFSWLFWSMLEKKVKEKKTQQEINFFIWKILLTQLLSMVCKTQVNDKWTHECIMCHINPDVHQKVD